MGDDDGRRSRLCQGFDGQPGPHGPEATAGSSRRVARVRGRAPGTLHGPCGIARAACLCPARRHAGRRAPGPPRVLAFGAALHRGPAQRPARRAAQPGGKDRHRLGAGEPVFHVLGAIAPFGRRLVAERTKDGITGARAMGKHPGRQPVDRDKVAAALRLVQAGLSPTAAARQVGLGRATMYREVAQAGVRRPA